MSTVRNSFTHPLQIATVAVPGLDGAVGITFCPGKRDRQAATGIWDRDLAADLLAIRDWGAVAVVTLMERHELERLGVPHLGAAVEAMGMRWVHAPIVDVSVPDWTFDDVWDGAAAEVRADLKAGRRVLFHCRGGLGRSGTIAARTLVELGMAPDTAIMAVRRVRPGAIETPAQERHVRQARPLDGSAPSPAAERRSHGRAAGRAADPAGPSEVARRTDLARSPGNQRRKSGAEARRDRAMGALVGLAVGDAVGTTLEFRPRDSYTPLTDMVGGGPFGLEPGQWTDDTSMALCLGDSLIAADGFDAADLMQRFVGWWRRGENSPTGRCFDIGNTVSVALSRFQRDGDAFAGATGANTAGNGSLMRLAPVALRWAHDEETAAAMAAEQSRTTHAAPAAVDACRVFARLLVRAIDGAPKPSVLQPWTGPALDGLDPAVAEVMTGSWRDKPRPQIRASGYVVHSLEAALWSVDRASDFRDAVLTAANLGEDADTTAAIAGQLAGGVWGTSGIPTEWLERLAWREIVVRKAERLFERSNAESQQPRGGAMTGITEAIASGRCRITHGCPSALRAPNDFRCGSPLE